MKVEYLENNDLAIFDEKKFRRDKVTGYYLNSNIRKRLHIYVWEYFNGDISKGNHIHHIKGKEFNDIEDLVMLSKEEHSRLHSVALTEEKREWYRNNLHINARPKASEWHKSEEGREWHKKHYEKTKDKFHKEINLTCEFCGYKYITSQVNSRFCSNKCKSAWRRKEGLDNEVRICEYCNNEFMINKYSKTKTCSRSCSNRLTPRLPQLKK